MKKLIRLYDRMIELISGKFPESLMLLFVRITLAGIFWRSGRTKVVEDSWLTVNDTTFFLFEEEYANVPLPADFAAHMATYAEALFPIMLVLGLFTRFSAMALLGMTIVIQYYVYPDAWDSVHSLWVAMALTLIVRGGGMISTDFILHRGNGRGKRG